jgi:hypothetical protein
MAVEISSYEKFLADRHGTDHTIQIFPELPLGAVTKVYLRGIGTDHIQSQISSYHPDQDYPVVSSSNLYDSILKAPIDQEFKIPTLFLPDVAPVYQSLKPVFSTSFAL